MIEEVIEDVIEERTTVDGTIPIEVNGEPRRARAGTTVRDLLQELRVPADRIAVELNRDLLARDGFGRTLAAGDRVEVVTFVGGG